MESGVQMLFGDEVKCDEAATYSSWWWWCPPLVGEILRLFYLLPQTKSCRRPQRDDSWLCHVLTNLPLKIHLVNTQILKTKHFLFFFAAKNNAWGNQFLFFSTNSTVCLLAFCYRATQGVTWRQFLLSGSLVMETMVMELPQRRLENK